jgi:tape measure domain-containing protein
LIAKGFKADQAQDLVKAMADLKSVVPDANIGNLLLAITQIKSKGVLQMEELQGQIAEAGLSVSDVLEEIGKGIGKSGAEVRKLISQGKISADQGVAGIMAAIQKTTGKPIGKAAEEASKSLGGLLSRLEQIPGGLLLMADASKGVGVLKDVLGNVLKAFSPSTDSGKALAASLGRLGDAFATFLSGLTGADGAKTLEDFARSMATAADKAADLVKSIGELSGPALSEFMKGFTEASKALDGDKAKANAPGYSELGKALGSVAKSLGMLTALSADVNLLGGGLGQLLGLAGQSKSVSVGIGDLLVAALGPLALLDDFSVIGSKISALWDQLMGAISGASAGEDRRDGDRWLSCPGNHRGHRRGISDARCGRARARCARHWHDARRCQDAQPLQALARRDRLSAPRGRR